MKIDTYQIKETTKRFESRKQHREKNLELIEKHRYFDIDTPERVKKFLSQRGYDDTQLREIMSTPVGFPPVTKPLQDKLMIGLERIMGTNDLVPIYYLHEGITKSKSVGRVWVRNSNLQVVGYGTGSLISPRLLITNFHILPDAETAKASLVEFNYQMNLKGQLDANEIFTLDADTFYFRDEYLDYAVVAVQPLNKKGTKLSSFGWNPLIEEEGKAIISQWVSIIQHPNGEPKQIGLRENQIIDMLPDFIHYKTDTSPGSSGSPVFNEKWEIVALHHSGVPEMNGAGEYMTTDGKIWNPSMGEDKIKWKANEGIRISKILKHLKTQNMTQQQTGLLNETNANPPASPAEVAISSLNKTNVPPASSSTFKVSDDGTATWTIPVSISVRMGGNDIVNMGNTTNLVNPSIESPSGIDITADSLPKNQEEVLIMARQEFSKRKDVLKVDLGYKFKNGWITKERCIVITVLKRKTINELKQENISAIPSRFQDYPIEVVEPTFQDLIAFHFGQDKLEGLLPPMEISREEIRYTQPPGLSLAKTTGQMRVIAHVSPEQGWENLYDFLKSCKKTLTIAMYDFGAPHIVETIKSIALPTFKELVVVMQPGSSVGEGTKKDDLADEDAVLELSNTFGAKFKNAWVNRGKINGWISSSYHIKVAVADSKKFWLSSGNWQSSNQPDTASPALSGKNQKFLLKNYNRDWHTIIEHSALAKTFEAYIKYDFDNNKQTISPDEAALLKQLNFVINAYVPVEMEEVAIPYKAFPVFNEKRNFTVTPILTPDNYFDIVIDLIRSATSSLYIQNQTFNAPSEFQEKLQELIDAIIERQQAGIEVKVLARVIIASEARKNITKLQESGFDVSCIKLDPKCHTKGIMVDGEKVLIGSHNMSNDGISMNRDASLLFEDTELTSYFEEIFKHDYSHARQNIGNESIGIELLPEGATVPENKIKITWAEALETI